MKKRIILISLILLICIFSLICLTACNNSRSFQNKLKEEGYKVEVDNWLFDRIEYANDYLLNDFDVKWMLYAYDILDSNHTIMIVKFRDKYTAKGFYKVHQNECTSNFTIKRKGRVVAYGHPSAVNIVMN